ncbi:MAG TPA: hypothetical protein VLJ61_01250 [Pyrinomonadaceae bacterium]|nr:hypothetical protein [Pyrinomonadaceae bacterium]
MPSNRLVMPLLNKTVIGFEDPAFYLRDQMFIETIYIEDLGAFFSGVNDEYKDGLGRETKCVYIEEPSFDSFLEYAKKTAIKVKYALNFFATEHPVILPYAYLLSAGDNRRSSSIVEIADIEAVANLHKLKTQEYAVNADREKLSDFYKIIDQACENHQPALFTLDRFNSCLIRAEEIDRMVDACVSLESLISGNQELSFRFSLYHSLISEADPEKRAAAFDSFKNLYSARSGIVHGDIKERDLTKVRSNWKSTMSLAMASLNYFLAYLFEKPAIDWDKHLRNLALGIERRIID